MSVERVVHRELASQALLVGNTQKRESLRHRPQSQALHGDVLLAFDIGGADDQAQSVQCWVAECEVLEDGLKRTPPTAMIQLHLWQARRIVRRRVLRRR